MIKLSIIIPALNEEHRIGSTLQALMRSCAGSQIIVVDGGSTDHTVREAKKLASLVLSAKTGRSAQMNAGARRALGDVLVFSPADAVYPNGFCAGIKRALNDPKVVGGGCMVQFNDPRFVFRFIEWSSNLRACVGKIFYLDQALFVRKDAFKDVGGFSDVKVMEETVLCDRLKQIGRLAGVPTYIVSSPRRFIANGPVRTWLKMGLMRVLYLLGARQETLWRVWSSLKRGT